MKGHPGFYALLFLSVFTIHCVQASEEVFRDSQFISGKETKKLAFQIRSDGKYKLSLTDYQYGNRFDSLQVSIRGNGINYNLDGSGASGTLKLPPGTYFAYVSGQSDPLLNLGLYGVSLSAVSDGIVLPGPEPSQVPLPPALLLLGSALGFGLIKPLLRRHRGRKTNS